MRRLLAQLERLRKPVFLLLTCICSILSCISPAKAQTFVHPGVAFNLADLNQLKANITRDPWLSAYNTFKSDYRSQLSYTPGAPQATVTRAPDLNNTQWKNDMVAVHNMAWMWWFTGDSTYARKATNILDGWAVTNTVWGGNESMLDIGDYAQYWGVGAEILRSTFPGWTAANTQHVKNYFANVLFPTSWVPSALRDANKGALQLKIALAASVFCDDATRFNQAIAVYRMDAGGGMRNSLPNGEVGDSGRDDHWRVQAAALAWGAEVAYKQGVDMYSELGNRVLAIGELYHKYAFDGATMTYIPFGNYASYWTSWGIQPGARAGDMTNLIYSAYNIRKGIPTPNTDRMRAALMQPGSTNYSPAGGDFLYLKSSDTSTAVALAQVYYPADHVQAVSNLTNIDIGNTGLAGSATYNNGIWTVNGAGTSTSTAFNFNFKKVSGDAGLVVKVENMSLTTGGCGVMLRQSLAPGSAFWDIFLGATGGVGKHWQPKAPWWLKIERVGTRIFAYHSQDGINWTNLSCWYSATGFPTDLYAGFYTLSNNTSALNTATFSNVAYSQSAPAGSPDISSATTATATIGAPFSYNIIAGGNPSSYSASGLPAGLSINTSTGVISGTPTAIGQSEVAIAATNASGIGTATLILNVINNQAPAAPASVVASVVNTTQIKLTWAASTSATSYSVKRSQTHGGAYATIQAGVTGTSFTDVTPVPEVNNYYVITALTGNSESGNSNEVFASVPPAAPAQPAVVNNSNSIGLSWNSASGAATYNVKRATVSGGPYTKVANVSTTAYTDVNVSSGSPYYYVVSSVGATKESANSPEAFGVPGASSSVWSPTPITDSLNLAGNWIGNAVPVNPAILTFGAASDSVLTNNITGLVASRILFGSAANGNVISGNAITLKNDLVNNSSRPQTLTTPLQLTDQLNVNTATGDVVLNGGISGTGSLMKSGSAVLYINGSSNNAYSGNTIIVSGTVAAAGLGTGTASNPTAGPLGTGKIQLNGGALQATAGANLQLYNDIEVLPGNRSYMYEDIYSISLYGKLIGTGTVQHDGNDYAGLNLLGDNSQFAGTFISKLRSGKQRIRFGIPQSGSANATWTLDANAVDCHGIGFSSGTLNFGALNGRGYIRADAGGSPVISIGALNTYSSYGGTINANGSSLTVVKVGTGILEMWGNQAYGGTTTVQGGKLLINNDPSSGVFVSPVIIQAGSLGGFGVSQSSATIGTGSGTGAILEPGFLKIGTLRLASLTLKSDATYQAELNLGTGVGDSVVAKTVTLNNPKLQLIPTAGTLPMGTSYTIINNTGGTPINGTFQGLPEMSLISAGGYDFRITYKGGKTGADVVLLDDRTKGVTITSALTDTVFAGKPYSYTIAAIKSPNVFSATGLPTGLSVNTSTGLISGVPTQAGLFTVVITASNGSTADTAKLALNIQSNIVSNLSVIAGDAQAIVAWSAIAKSNFTYHVKRSTSSGGPYTTIANTSASSYLDVNVNNGTTYYYVIASADTTRENPNSPEISATPFVTKYSYWPFDESSGTTATDIWSGRTATLNTTATWVAGNFNTGIHADATATSYTSLPTGVVSGLTDFTISAWVKQDVAATWARTFDFGTGTSVYMFMAPKGGTGFPRFAITTGGSAGEQGINGTAAIPAGVWTHMAVTQSGSTAILYINGVEVGRNSAMTLTPSSLGNTTKNYIGKSQFSDPVLNGTVDDFRIYSKALTATEINVLKNIQSQTITFNALAQQTVGNPDLDPGATASSGLPVSYTSSDTTIAKIVNGKIHAKAAGTVTITALQAGNGFYAGTAKTQSLSILGPPPIPVVTAVSNTQVILSWTSSTGATSYNVKRSTVSGGPYTTIASPTTASYTDAAVTRGSIYYYVVTAVNGVGESQPSAQVIMFVGKPLTGALIGTSGSFNNNSATTIAAARDGNLSTYFDANVVTGAWVGIDLGTDSSAVVSYVGFAPRASFQSRMVNGVFQGANKADFSDAVTLTTITTAPPYSVITTQTVSNTATYRYLRYLGPTNGSCNIAELQFWGQMRKNQTITFNAIPQKQMGDVDFDPAATASSGLPVSYSSSNTAVAAIVNNKVHLVGIGTATITASQTGNINNAVATPVTQTLTVVADHTAPVITVVSGPVTLALDASGSKTVALASVATVVDNYTVSPTVTLTPASFTCATTGSQTVTITATDANGNTSTATKTVTVVDNIAPTVKTQNITVNLDATGKVTITPAQINNSSTDNCSIATLTLDKTMFDCSNIGPNTVTLTATDASGNTSSATAIVTVKDVTAPTAVAKNITVQLDATGNVSITPAQINNGSIDNCSVASYSLDQTSFDCSNVGQNNVTLTVTDANGNSSTATAVVTVQDSTAPLAIAQNITVQLDATGRASITSAQINNGSTDNCSIATFALDKSTFDCSNVGQNNVTLTVTDGSGNASTATAVVTVQDITAPVAIAKNITVQLDAAGEASITPAQINNGSTDNCSIATYALDRSGFDCSNIGENIVTLTVTDGSGNASTATALVTVQDTIKPVFTSTQSNTIVALDAITGKAVLADYTTAATASDNCSISGITQFPLAGTALVINEPTTVTLTVKDPSGNTSTQSFTITATDQTAPFVPVLADVTGECSATATAPTTTDNFAGAVIGTTTDELTYNTQGTHVIHWSFADGNGNISTATQNVVIKDVTAPIVPVLADVTGECSATATVPTTTDNCAGTVTGTTTDEITYNTQGTHVIHWSFADGNGNISTATQNVVIKDVTAPIVPVLADVTGECSATATAPTTTDNCAGTVTGTTTDPLTYTTQGTYVIHWSFSDGNGNVSTATQNVVIKDVTAPIVPVLADVTGECSATATAPTTTDNCAGTVTGTTTDALTYTTQGTHVIHWSFDDGNGNVSTATQNVIVKDDIAPVAIAQNITVQLDATGKATITPAQINNGSSDNCSAVTLALDKTTFDCSNVGQNNVTLTVTDASGNSSIATAVVTVRDNTAPVAIAQNITVQLDATGKATITPAQINNGSTDNCAIASYSLDKSTFDNSNYGANTVTLTVTDTHGNASSATAIVTVQDNIPPAVITKNITVYLSGGAVTITPAQVDNGSSDAGGIKSMTLNKTSFDCSSQGANTVTLTVTDNHNNTATGIAVVTVIGKTPNPAISVSRSNTTYTGLSANTIALGYGAQSLALTATDANSATGDTFSWSPATGLSSTTIANPVFTPTQAGTYTFTVTATSQYGCQASTSVTINVIDVRCGDGVKVLVYNATGSSTNPYVLQCVSPNSVPAKLANGGTLSETQVQSTSTTSYTATDEVASTEVVTKANPQVALKAYPNPFGKRTTVTFNLPAFDANVTLEVYNTLGNKVATLYKGSIQANVNNEYTFDGSNLAPGIYFARLITSKGVQTFRLVMAQ